VNEHPECQGAKMNALSPDAHWDWEQTARGIVLSTMTSSLKAGLSLF